MGARAKARPRMAHPSATTTGRRRSAGSAEGTSFNWLAAGMKQGRTPSRKWDGQRASMKRLNLVAQAGGSW